MTTSGCDSNLISPASLAVGSLVVTLYSTPPKVTFPSTTLSTSNVFPVKSRSSLASIASSFSSSGSLRLISLVSPGTVILLLPNVAFVAVPFTGRPYGSCHTTFTFGFTIWLISNKRLNSPVPVPSPSSVVSKALIDMLSTKDVSILIVLTSVGIDTSKLNCVSLLVISFSAKSTL